MLLSAMQGLSRDLYEAARIDGAFCSSLLMIVEASPHFPVFGSALPLRAAVRNA